MTFVRTTRTTPRAAGEPTDTQENDLPTLKDASKVPRGDAWEWLENVLRDQTGSTRQAGLSPHGTAVEGGQHVAWITVHCGGAGLLQFSAANAAR